ncbi:unnamed protein product [Trichogramma brassicae]|uniref:Uncharacterized protein n=1 Tax=Trichogramma brassicae TaxID=86971 RepID=A0A6H5IJS5_9HYME|nr:unnamed protein product [Trichogramma brassicae]
MFTVHVGLHFVIKLKALLGVFYLWLTKKRAEIIRAFTISLAPDLRTMWVYYILSERPKQCTASRVFSASLKNV